MARTPRTFIPGVPVHLIQRGNNRNNCFFQNCDYAIYMEKLSEYGEQFGVAIHSYVLMTNHVHMLATPTAQESISRMMHSLGAYYVRYINSRYGRTGTLWEGRYKNSLIDSERYFLTVSRYIELNPVRANMCRSPAEYPWSSYHHLTAGAPSTIISLHPMYTALGSCDRERRQRYQALFLDHIPEPTLKEIRNAYNKTWVLGDNPFKRKIESHLGYALPPYPRGRPKKSDATHDIRRI